MEHAPIPLTSAQQYHIYIHGRQQKFSRGGGGKHKKGPPHRRRLAKRRTTKRNTIAKRPQRTWRKIAKGSRKTKQNLSFFQRGGMGRAPTLYPHHAGAHVYVT